MYVLEQEEQVEFQAVGGNVLGGGGGEEGEGFISGSSGCSISGWLLIKILYIGGERVIGCNPSFAFIPPLPPPPTVKFAV
jgi:hypothetical protein